EQGKAGTALHDYLAAEEVERLDAVRALVDRVEAVVAVELLHGVLPGVAVAAVDLDRQVVREQAPLGRPALGDRRQDVEQQVRPLAVGAGALLVDQTAAV